MPVALLPTETRLEPWTALRLLHQGERECVCLCECVCQGWGAGWGAASDPSEHEGLLSSASHSPQHEKHGCLSGSFPSASWFTSILLHSCPCQEQQGFGQVPSVISDGTKFSFICLLCWEVLSWHRLLHQTMTLPLSPSQLLCSSGAGTLAVYCISAGLVLPGRCFVMTASPEESTGINMQLICI